MAVENTNQYQGVSCAGGLISPMDGIGSWILFIESLVNRVQGKVSEVILASERHHEGDTTIFYLYKN